MIEKLLSTNSKKADVLLLGVEYDKTSSFGKGADKGPRAIIEAFDTQLEIYERFTKTNPARYLKISSMILSGLKEKTPGQMVKEVQSEFSKIFKNYKFVIGLGGEHSVSIGFFEGLSKIYGKNTKNATILQIDAHLDLREDDSDYNANPSRYAHSCAMKRCLDLGFRIVPVGTRAYAGFEMKTARKNGINAFEWPCDENKKLIQQILSSIKTKDVYITLDADGIDPSHMPATGTPVQGGLSWKFTFDLLKEVFEKKNVIGADIVEVAPRPNENLTEYGAAQLAYYMIGLKFRKG